jgi:hypothetical protein
LRSAFGYCRTAGLIAWTPLKGSLRKAPLSQQECNEIYLDVYERLASFEPAVKNLQQRLFDAYAAEVKRVSGNDDGIITAAQGDIDTATDGFPNNERLFLPPTVFNRFAVTREINDGLLAPRFAPSQRAWVLTGVRVAVNPTVDASTGRDGDDR